MKQNVSILLGSGFSMPEGLPSVSQINVRLSKIDEEEILIHSDQQAVFLNGQNDPNRWSRADERLFIQEFLHFYSNNVIGDISLFNYETFFDYYSGYLNENENKIPIEEFYKKFVEVHLRGEDKYSNCYNRVADFNRTYNQLLASLLYSNRYIQDTNLVNYSQYWPFIQILVELLKEYDLKVHSLNHDLFFDCLARNHTKFHDHFCDGFQLEGSPFYGTVDFNFNKNTPNEVYKNYYVKLKYFTGKFDKALCFYKLHGSVYTKKVYTAVPNQKLVRIQNNYGVYGYYIEVIDNANQEYRFERLGDEVPPDFISGTTNKSRYYKGDSFYANLLKHFEDNLSSSKLLIVIGYGFRDPGINEYLEKCFLSKGGRMIIINPNISECRLFEKYYPEYILLGVNELKFEEHMEIIRRILTDES